MEEALSKPPAEVAEWFELGHSLGQNHAFAVVAGRCSAAQAASLCRLREQKLYQRCGLSWDEFCPAYVKISRSEADRIIRLWQEFGAGYFELAQLTRVSAETYRLIAPSIKDGCLTYNGEAIELNPENSRQVAAAVAEMRRTLPARNPARQMEPDDRLGLLDRHATTFIHELQDFARQIDRETVRIALTCLVYRMNDELAEIAHQHGLEY